MLEALIRGPGNHRAFCMSRWAPFGGQRISWGFGLGSVLRKGGAESGGVTGGSGEKPMGFGVAEAKVWGTGADSERFGGKVVRKWSSLRESGAEAVGLSMESVGIEGL